MTAPAAGAPRRLSNLALRCLSAAVLAPVAVGAVALGGGWLAAFLAVVCVAATWEWLRLADPVDWLPLTPVVLPLQAAVIALAHGVGPAVGAGTALAAGVSAAALARPGAAALLGAGTAYVGLFGVSVLALAATPGAVLWLFLVVWASDIGGYAVGRALGGPKLAPSISPGKTWSGFLGAVLGAGAVGAVAAAGAATPMLAGLLGCALGALGQGGDLMESALKRRAGVKDSSRLIPGHGGVLDRVDALMAVAPVLALVCWLAAP